MFLLKDVFLLKISFCVYFASKKFPRISQKTAMVLTNVSLQEYLKICRSDRWNYLGMFLSSTKANVWQLTSATFSLEFQHYTGCISNKPLWVKLSFQLKSLKTKITKIYRMVAFNIVPFILKQTFQIWLQRFHAVKTYIYR